ncbi:MAG: hypothetical protein AABZ44_10635, partial [Elusimicrobiota bacterium]
MTALRELAQEGQMHPKSAAALDAASELAPQRATRKLLLPAILLTVAFCIGMYARGIWFWAGVGMAVAVEIYLVLIIFFATRNLVDFNAAIPGNLYPDFSFTYQSADEILARFLDAKEKYEALALKSKPVKAPRVRVETIRQEPKDEILIAAEREVDEALSGPQTKFQSLNASRRGSAALAAVALSAAIIPAMTTLAHGGGWLLRLGALGVLGMAAAMMSGGVNKTGPPALGLSQRPDVLSLPAQLLPENDPNWDNSKTAKLEALAEILELYPDYQIYFLARDAEYLHDLARVLLEDSADAKRVHVVNVSRANMRDAHVLDYLKQEGLDAQKLAQGQKALFVDTGFSGTISRVVDEQLPAEAKGRIKTKLLASGGEHPSTRVFLQALNPEASVLLPGAMHGTVSNYEHTQKYTRRSSFFELLEGLWRPMEPADPERRDVGDPRTPQDKEKALALMRDLLYFGRQESVKQRFNARRALWRSHVSMRDKDESIKSWREFLAQGEPLAEAMARDFVEFSQVGGGGLVLSLEDLGLPVVAGAVKWQSNKEQLVLKHPQWKSIIEDPETHIAALIDKGDWQTLGNIVDAVEDSWFMRDVFNVIHNRGPGSPRLLALAKAVIKKGWALEYIIQKVLHEKWSDHPEVIREIMKLEGNGFNDPAGDVARYVLSEPHWHRKHPQLVADLIKTSAYVDSLLVQAMPVEFWGEHPEMLKTIIKKNSSYTFEKLIWEMSYVNAGRWAALPGVIDLLLEYEQIHGSIASRLLSGRGHV